MSPTSIMHYYEEVYGRPWPADIVIGTSLRACDVSTYYSVNEDDHMSFIDAVCTHKIATDEVFRTEMNENKIKELA